MPRFMKCVVWLGVIAVGLTVGQAAWAQADWYWSGKGASSDNIDQADNWWAGSGNPSAGDNLYFNNTEGSRHWPYCNYGPVYSYFGNIITYSGAGGIKWRGGDRTYAYKFENNNDSNLFVIEADIGNRSGSDLQLNPVGSGGLTVSNSVALSGANWIQVHGGNTLTIDGVISGNGGININDTGVNPTVILNGDNTYADQTLVNDGILQVGHNNALGTTGGNTVIADNAKLYVDGSAGDLTIADPLTIGSGQGVINNRGGNNTLSGAVTLSNDVDLRRSAGTLTFSGGISSANKSFGINLPVTITNNPVSIGSGTFGVTSGETLVEVGGNDWGLTRLNFSGTLKLGVDNALPSDTDIEFGWSTVESSTSTVDLNGHDQTIRSLHWPSWASGGAWELPGSDRSVTDSSGSGTLTINLDSGTKTHLGNLEGGLSLVKEGAGTQVLRNLNSTASSYTGSTTVNGGVLQAGTSDAFGNNSAVTVGGSGTLKLDGNSLSIGSLAGAGTVENAGEATPIDDDFSSDNVTYFSARVWEDQIDTGWITCHDTEWFVSGGVVANAATTSGGYPDARPAEGAFAQVVTNPHDGSAVTFSFDYSVASGDILYANFWGYTGVVSGVDAMLMNTEPCNGYVSNLDADTAPSNSTLDAFNLKDGASSFHGSPSTSISGALTGSGSYSVTVNIADLGISGVSSLADFSYIAVIFLKEEDGSAGSTTLDNIQVLASQTTLTLGADNTSPTFSGTLQDGVGGGPLAIAKVGTGTQTLSGNNTYSGWTAIDGGTLQVGSATAIPSGTDVAVASGATLKLNGNSITVDSLTGSGIAENANASAATLTVGDASTNTFSGTNKDGTGGGALSFTKAGDGTLVLSGANTYTGATTADGGTLILEAPSAYYGYSGGQININTGSTLRVQGSYLFQNKTFVFGSNGGGNMDIGAGNNVFRSDHTFTTLGGSQNTITQSSTWGLNCDGSGTRTFDVADGSDDADLLISAQLSGDGSVSKVGDGTLVLSNNNSYSGGTKIGNLSTTTEGGTVNVQHSSALGTGDITFEQGGTLEIGASGLTLTTGPYVPNWGGGTRTLRLDLAGSNTGEISGNIDIRFATGYGFVQAVGTDDTLTLSGVLSTGADGGAGLTKVGDGTLVVSGNNTYSGTTTISNGVFQMGHNNALGGTSQGTVINSGGALDTAGFDPSSSESFTLNGAGPDGVGGNGALYSTASGTVIGSTTTLGSDAEIGGSQRVDWNGQITDGANAYTLTKTGSGFYGLWNGTADYENLVVRQGACSITDLPHGTVTVTNSGSLLGTWGNTTLGTGDIVFHDGTIFENALDSAGSVAVAGTMTLNGDVTFRNWNIASTISAAIGGTGNLTLQDYITTAGTYTLTGTNTYTGNTTITALSVTIGGTGSLGSGSYAGAIVNNGSLTYASTTDQTLSGLISGSGSLTFDPPTGESATLTLSNGANSFNGGVTVVGESVSPGVILGIAAEGAAGTGPITTGGWGPYIKNTSGGTLTVANPFTATGYFRLSSVSEMHLTGLMTKTDNSPFACVDGTLYLDGKITGSAQVDLWGAGTRYLTNDENDFTGRLYCQNGGLTYISSIGNKGVASTAGAGTQLTLAHGGYMIYNGAAGSTSDRDFDLAGGGGNNSLSVTGTGYLRLVGGTFTHATSGAKTQYLDGDNTGGYNELGYDLIDSTNDGSVLSVIKNGSCTWRLSGNSTYTGDTTINAGTLALATGGSLSLAADGIVTAGSGATLDIIGGTLAQDLEQGAGVDSIFGGVGTVSVQSGALQVTNGVAATGITVAGPIEISGGDVDLVAQMYFDELTVTGDAATIDVGWLGNSASAAYVFELDSDGVSSINVTNWGYIGNASITVDGSAYTANGNKTITLMSFGSMQDTCPSVSTIGFGVGYSASIEQDQDADEVRLVISGPPGPSLFLFK